MRPPVLRLSHELIIDSFAGGGGTSCGIEMALGRSPDIAINHDPEAIAMHQTNHPNTRHYLTSVWHVEPVTACAGRPVGLMWLSPDCTFHSKARGGKPFRERDPARRRRGLAWVAVRWAAAVRPRVIILENVEEFAKWGPLGPDGKPCPLREGLTFRRFVKQLQNLGYAVDWQELRACDYGAPTIRKRLFLVARCDGLPIVWPEPTHGTRLVPYRTAAECIDWSIPCPSIFERERPLADNTLRRIARGLQKYVIDSPEPFIVGIDNKSNGARDVWSSNEPLRTITVENRFAMVAPTLVQTGYGERDGQSPRSLDIQKPLGTIVGSQKHALVTAFLAKHYGGVVGQRVNQTLGTVTTVDHHSLVTASLGKCGGNFDQVRAFLLKFYGNEKDGQSMRFPLGTVTTKDRFGIVTVHGQDYAITDIGMRMLAPRELYRAQGFPDAYIIDLPHDGKPLTKTAQVRMCGNSVSPPAAAAIVRAQFWIETQEEIAA